MVFYVGNQAIFDLPEGVLCRESSYFWLSRWCSMYGIKLFLTCQRVFYVGNQAIFDLPEGVLCKESSYFWLARGCSM